MDADLLQRVGRIYAAARSTEETDPKKLRATVVETDIGRSVFQDFRNGLSDEQLANDAYAVIHNIANLHDHLKKWAARTGNSKERVKEVFQNSFELQVITDLSNNDKHGYPPRNGGKSRKAPKLMQINRVMRLATNPQAGSMIGMRIGADGTPAFFGDGNAKAVVTGDVVDRNGGYIGDLHDIANKAIRAWEALLTEFRG